MWMCSPLVWPHKIDDRPSSHYHLYCSTQCPVHQVQSPKTNAILLFCWRQTDHPNYSDSDSDSHAQAHSHSDYDPVRPTFTFSQPEQNRTEWGVKNGSTDNQGEWMSDWLTDWMNEWMNEWMRYSSTRSQFQWPELRAYHHHAIRITHT